MAIEASAKTVTVTRCLDSSPPKALYRSSIGRAVASLTSLKAKRLAKN